MGKTLMKLTALAVALPILVNATAAAGDTTPIAGVWVTEDMSEITIQPCEAGHCGYISKIVIPDEIYRKNKSAIDKIGTANLFDHMNKDPLLRERPIQGLEILTLNQRETEHKYVGKVYNPEDGNTYTGIVQVLDGDTIRLTGCGFFDLLCKSEDWSRVR